MNIVHICYYVALSSYITFHTGQSMTTTDDISGFSTPDIDNNTGQSTEDSLCSLQTALNSLKVDISSLGEDVIAQSMEKRFDESSM